jgi:multidrug efflux pump subunit AcrA (membrane-fusion protein)
MREVLSKQFRMPTWFPLLLSVGMILASCGPKADKPWDRGVRQHLVEVALVQSDKLNVVGTRTGTLRARR